MIWEEVRYCVCSLGIIHVSEVLDIHALIQAILLHQIWVNQLNHCPIQNIGNSYITSGVFILSQVHCILAFGTQRLERSSIEK